MLEKWRFGGSEVTLSSPEWRNSSLCLLMGLPGHCLQGIEVTLEKVATGLYKIVFFSSEEEESQKRERRSLLHSCFTLLFWVCLAIASELALEKEEIGR